MKQGPTLRHLRIHCTSPGSVKLVEHELWQREEKGLIGILPVQDVAEAATVDSVLSQGMGSDSGERSSGVQVCTSDSHRLDGWGKSAGTYSLSYKVYLNQNLFCYGLESVSILWVHNLTYR